jgi:hypothetical protein
MAIYFVVITDTILQSTVDEQTVVSETCSNKRTADSNLGVTCCSELTTVYSDLISCDD